MPFVAPRDPNLTIHYGQNHVHIDESFKAVLDANALRFIREKQPNSYMSNQTIQNMYIWNADRDAKVVIQSQENTALVSKDGNFTIVNSSNHEVQRGNLFWGEYRFSE